MEIKKLILAAAAAAALMIPLSAHAADEVIYEHGRVETADTYTDLDGWGRELYTKCFFEADVRFKAPGSGITLRSADNERDGTSIRAVMLNDKLTLAADGGTGAYYIYYIELDTDTTYHIKLVGNYGVTGGGVDMTVDTLDKDGNVTDTKDYYMILMNKMFASSGVGPEHIRVEANTVADNIRVTELRPDAVRIVSPPAAVTPGSSALINARFERQGKVIDYDMPVTYTVSGEGVNIAPDGTLSVAADAQQQRFTVTAKSGDMADTAELEVVSGDIFTIDRAIMNEEGTVLEALAATKNYFFDGTAAFVVMVYSQEGTLKDSFVKYVPAKAVPQRKETEIAMGYALPEGAEDDIIEIRAWSAAPEVKLEKPEGESVMVRRFFEDNGGAVEWISEHRTVVGMLNAKTMVMQLGTPVIFGDGEAIELSVAPCLDENDNTILPAL